MTARVFATAGAVALAIAACGAPSVTLVSLRAHATRVCTQAHDRGARIAPPAVPARTAAFLRHGIAVLEPELTGLRTLRVPSEQAGAYAAALQSLTRELTILRTTVHDLDRGSDPVTTIKTLQHRLAPVEADYDAVWRTLDVPACLNR
jgi:hypothetical protein